MLNDNNTCFICLDSLNDSNKQIFAQYILNKMTCNYY